MRAVMTSLVVLAAGLNTAAAFLFPCTGSFTSEKSDVTSVLVQCNNPATTRSYSCGRSCMARVGNSCYQQDDPRPVHWLDDVVLDSGDIPGIHADVIEQITELTALYIMRGTGGDSGYPAVPQLLPPTEPTIGYLWLPLVWGGQGVDERLEILIEGSGLYIVGVGERTAAGNVRVMLFDDDDVTHNLKYLANTDNLEQARVMLGRPNLETVNWSKFPNGYVGLGLSQSERAVLTFTPGELKTAAKVIKAYIGTNIANPLAYPSYPARLGLVQLITAFPEAVRFHAILAAVGNSLVEDPSDYSRWSMGIDNAVLTNNWGDMSDHGRLGEANCGEHTYGSDEKVTLTWLQIISKLRVAKKNRLVNGK